MTKTFHLTPFDKRHNIPEITSTKSLCQHPDALKSANMEETIHTRGSLSPAPSSNVTDRQQQDFAINEIMARKPRTHRLSRERSLDLLVEDHDTSHEMDLLQEMEAEKIRFPGASSWAPDEERLFEIMFLRQDLPMLPPNWDMDFCGVPISDHIFQTSEENPAIIYAHAKEFRATMALMRLIDLTSEVRSNLQSGLRRKVPRIIKKELDRYISWAAQDGNYHHLRVIPNIMTEIINIKQEGDIETQGEEITRHILSRMRDLARLQREFLRVDRDPSFWDVVKPSIMASPRVKLEPEDLVPTPEKWATVTAGRGGLGDEVASDASELDETTIKVEREPKRRRLFSCSTTDGDELVEYDEVNRNGTHAAALPERDGCPSQANQDSTQTPTKGKKTTLKRRRESTPPPSSLKPKPASRPSRPSPRRSPGATPTPPSPKTPVRPTYIHPPPVVYGLFILDTHVLLLTTDSAKGDGAYVSFHVEANFKDTHQGVWNALTVAAAVCRARDELRTRADDFEPVPCEVEDDPDRLWHVLRCVKHAAALDKRPHAARSHAAKPTGHAFGAVDDLEAGSDGGGVESNGARLGSVGVGRRGGDVALLRVRVLG
ncbi:hypothetical protein G7046_g9831 [Stylonectria norvegica]|nr:hypothetical protein G7046_g9831 [Stylonectria norvegica]